MKGIVLPTVLAALVTAVNIVIPFDGASRVLPVSLRGTALEAGVYDPLGRLASETDIKIEHIFVDWNMPPERTLFGLRTAEKRNRALMVTIEPSPRPGQNPETFTRDLLAGHYDSLLTSHCDVLAQARNRTFMRFGHEMDLANERYAWSGMNADAYVALYRHAIAVCRKSAPNTIAVWSPVGNPGLDRYYPGPDWVDVVGLSLFGLQPWEEIAYGRSRRFSEAFDEKYRLVAGYGKPISITEFGVCGTAIYRAQWLAEAINRGRETFPLLQSIIFFNDREPYRWPPAGKPSRVTSGCDVEYPDWSLGPRNGS